MKNRIAWPAFLGTALILLLFCMFSATMAADPEEQVIRMTARKFEYSPSRITLKKGIPAIMEITALDRVHGFSCPELEIRADLLPGKVARIQFTPQKTGTFAFHCDIFCGDGHEEMSGTITIRE